MTTDLNFQDVRTQLLTLNEKLVNLYSQKPMCIVLDAPVKVFTSVNKSGRCADIPDKEFAKLIEKVRTLQSEYEGWFGHSECIDYHLHEHVRNLITNISQVCDDLAVLIYAIDKSPKDKVKALIDEAESKALDKLYSGEK